MEKRKLVSVAELMDRADAIKKRERRTAVLEIAGFGSVKIVEPTKAMVEDGLQIEGEDGDAHLIAECIVEPTMKDPALLAKFGVPVADELVKVIFRQGDRATIARKILSLGGYDGSGVKVIDDAKN